MERIRGLYRSEGFLNAVVDDPVVTMNAAQTRADVLVRVEEGTRYRFGKIDFAGDVVFFGPNGVSEDLHKQIAPFESRPYTPQQVTNMQRGSSIIIRRAATTTSRSRCGDPRTAVNGEVRVLFQVDTGSVYRFDGVTQEGLDRLARTFCRIVSRS